mgnify:CR=1 FL=1
MEISWKDVESNMSDEEIVGKIDEFLEVHPGCSLGDACSKWCKSEDEYKALKRRIRKRKSREGFVFY